MQRRWCGVSVLVVLSSHAFAASLHRLPGTKPIAVGASASTTFDRVPVAAERIAAAYGVVTSTFRTVAHNREVGGVPDSYHLLGRAIDVARRPGVSHARIAAALRAAGYFPIESLDEGDHSHFAFGPRIQDKPSPALQPAALTGPRLAADEHGSLLSDLKPLRKGQRITRMRRAPE